MTHRYWSSQSLEGVNVIRSHPHQRRTLTIEGAGQLREILGTFTSSESVSPLVIEITIDHAELREVQEMSEGRPIADWAPWVEAIAAMANYPSLCIAAIPDQAACGGLEMALAADMRVAHPAATLGLYETRMGILPGAGGTQRLPRLIGHGQATALILSGDPISGDRAERIGLVEQLDDDPVEWAIRFARRCSRNGPNVLVQAKKALSAATPHDPSGFRTEGKAFLHLVGQETARRQMAMWLEDQELRLSSGG
ncbi:MAG: enoyl-CoA hydratase/isomerase family protein [Ilumatobacteraceae bacterium]